MTTASTAIAAFLTERVNLPKSSLDKLEVHVNGLWAALTTGDRLPSIPIDRQQQGSWAYSTIIRPHPGGEFDADVVLEFEDVGIQPKEYLLRVNQALASHGTYAEMTLLKDRCVRVQYAGEHHVDLVPMVCVSGRNNIVNRTSNQFERAEPVGYAEWFTERDDWCGGQLHKVVRLVKYLRDYKGTHATRSVILTTLLGNQVRVGDVFTDTIDAFVTLMGRLALHLESCPSKPNLPDPSCPESSFNHRWTEDEFRTLRTVVSSLAYRAELALASTSPAEATRRWRDLFGDSFPEVTSLGGASSSALVAAPLEQMAVNVFAGVVELYTARIDSVVLGKGMLRARQLGASVEKDRQLRFRVTTSTPGEYEVFWKVLNRGRESLGNRRGEIVLGGRDREETTLYRGHHYVEAYIVQNRVVVAKARRSVVIR